MFSSLLGYFMIIIPVLVNVAFFTLLERKILGLSQSRKGPNKVAWGGILQPFADAVKLFVKESFNPSLSNTYLFLMAPVIAIMLVLVMWGLTPLKEYAIPLSVSSLLFLVVLSLNLYPLLLAGWASNSKYAFIGAMRGVAQTISYEISLAMIILSFLVVKSTCEVHEWLSNENYTLFSLMAPLIFLWVIASVAETNRTPFDFAEGESELVSGFNIEYGAGSFALIFMAEYASILFLSMISAALLTGWGGLGAGQSIASISVAYFWVWLRASFPRYRYDLLMALAWKSMLPASLVFLTYFLVLCPILK